MVSFSEKLKLVKSIIKSNDIKYLLVYLCQILIFVSNKKAHFKWIKCLKISCKFSV